MKFDPAQRQVSLCVYTDTEHMLSLDLWVFTDQPLY